MLHHIWETRVEKDIKKRVCTQGYEWARMNHNEKCEEKGIKGIQNTRAQQKNIYSKYTGHSLNIHQTSTTFKQH